MSPERHYRQTSGSTKASNWWTGPSKASTVHSGTAGVIFCFDESVWRMDLQGDGITGLGVATWQTLCEYTLTFS